MLNPSDFSLASIGGIADATILINGSAFAGTGAGRFDPSETIDTPALDTNATQPNQTGRTEISADRGGSFGWDATNYSTCWLTGYLGRHEMDNTTASGFAFEESDAYASLLLT